MKSILLLLFLSICFLSICQFNTQDQVTNYLNEKKFYNYEKKVTVSYGFLSSYNAYAIKCVFNEHLNVPGELNLEYYEQVYIDCEIKPKGDNAEVSGRRDNGADEIFSFTIYDDKIWVQGTSYFLKH